MKHQNLIKMIVSIFILIIISNFTILGNENNLVNKSTSTFTTFDDNKDLNKDKVIVDKDVYNIAMKSLETNMENIKWFIGINSR